MGIYEERKNQKEKHELWIQAWKFNCKKQEW